MSVVGVNIDEMLRGDGQWKNMQGIVRKTLKACFDQMDRQNEHISNLTDQVNSLKLQMLSGVDREEVCRIVENRMDRTTSSSKKKFVPRADFDKLENTVYNIKNDVERKASIRYVDECMRKKVDRSDIIVRSLQADTVAKHTTQLTQLHHQLADVQQAIDGLTKISTELSCEIKATHEVGDYNLLKNQMEAIYASMNDYYTKTHIQALLDQKV